MTTSMQFRINTTTFEFNNNKLLINNNSIDCSPKLYQAFEVFLNSQNKVISKEELIKTLWGDLIVSDDSLFKIIQGLRTVFKQNDLEENVLVNVYGKGYRINPDIHLVEISKLQNNDSSSSSNFSVISYKTIIPVLFIVAAVAYFSLTKIDTFDNFPLRQYQLYKEKISIDPADTLIALNNVSNLNQESLLKLNFLKGFAYFNQGNYKQALIEFHKVINNNNLNTIATADSYKILAKIHLYKADEQSFYKYLTKAGDIYQKLDDTQGQYETQNLTIDHLVLIHDYPQAISLSHEFLDKAKNDNYLLGQIQANLNLTYIHKELNQPKLAKKYIQDTLEVASLAGDGKYMSIAYGTMAIDSMSEGDFTNAMNWANQTLKYAVVQPSTNNFQQGFSYMYNILSSLGHDQLAEKYLQKAIDVQNHFNPDGHLHAAEINLGILKVKLKKFQQAKTIFNQLLSYNLSETDINTVKAWIAINSYYIDDNISSYTAAKSVYNAKNVSVRNKFVAGIALVFSSIELERNDEADRVFTELSKQLNDDWLIAYAFYLEMTVFYSKEKGLAQYDGFISEQQSFAARIEDIKNNTQPDKKTLVALDNYLAKILN